MERAAESQAREWTDGARGAVEALCRRHGIAALDDFLENCRSFAGEKTLSVAIFGRFKAGKSSFLNRLIGRPLLPVGVIPVTSVITELEYGAVERAEAQFLDGHAESAAVERIGAYVSEQENPGNVKRAVLVRIELPAMEPYRGIRFVDTPGLESVFEHNTERALEWLPKVGLALVAVGVDPPLSQRDVELIGRLRRYTPHLALLLTKVDLLDESEREQVQAFIAGQLEPLGAGTVPIFPFSVRPGFESLRRELDARLFSQARAEMGERHAEILRHKVASLVEECAGYLAVALKAAESGADHRLLWSANPEAAQASLDDSRLALRLIARHAAATVRVRFEELLRHDEQPVRQRLLAGLEREFPAWTRSLAFALARFDEWLGAALSAEMTGLSERHREEFVEPVRCVGRQLSSRCRTSGTGSRSEVWKLWECP